MGLCLARSAYTIRLLSFSDVYGVRAVFSEQANGLTGYFLDWQANVINPLYIVYGIRFRRSFAATLQECWVIFLSTPLQDSNPFCFPCWL